VPVVVPISTPVTPDTKDATSFDGRIRAIDDPAYGGVRLKIDYSSDLASWSNPFQCTVYRRNADGTEYTVRGGDPYINYAGKGWLYDQEAPLGQSVSYYAVPIDANGTTGVRSASASIVTSAPSGGMQAPDMWLVNLEDPGASMQVRSAASLAGSYNGRSDKQVVLGSPYPAVTPDARNGLATQITVLTMGEDEFKAMQTLLQQSVIMRKSSSWERPDGYFTVDDVSYAAQSARLGVGIYAWQLGLTEVARPNTYGQTAMNPVYTLGAYTKQYPLFSDVPSTMPFDSVQGGNLMDSNTSDLDTDASQWLTLPTNTDIAWSADQAYRGSHSLKITCTTFPGEFGAYARPLYSVTQGTKYTFTAWIYSAVGLPVSLQLDWKDGAGTYLDSDSLNEWGLQVTLTPNLWTKVVIQATPITGAAFVTPVIRATSTAVGQVMYADNMSLENI
jgi:hypothetical protein